MTPQAKSTLNSNGVTVLVFKDNLAARTFKVPVGWISRIGILLGLAAIVTVVSVFFGLKYLRKASQLDPTRVKELERENSDLETAYAALRAKSMTIEQKADDRFGKPGKATAITAGPIPTLAPRTLPKEIDTLPEGILPRIGVSQLQVTYRNNTINILFNIEYIAQDQGNQRGRIVILARGPAHFLVYPKGVFAGAGSPSLLNTNKGETFSVSRFRQVRADFRSIAHSKVIQSVQILILNSRNQILINQTVPVRTGTPASIETMGPPLQKGLGL